MDMIAVYDNWPHRYLISDTSIGFDLTNKRKALGTTTIKGLYKTYGQHITVFYQEGMVGWK